jgi:hypothetical protein
MLVLVECYGIENDDLCLEAILDWIINMEIRDEPMKASFAARIPEAVGNRD